ncbi:MAG: hypothetical protein KGL39_16325 [Patescibacteria group bacterium]|nr:hypothetical protein [Patescibacteria group bacterium]
MARNFTAAFTACAAKKAALPYLVFEADWSPTQTPVYYLDRPATAFVNNDGKRVPTSGVDPNVLVMTWPQVSLSLKEGQVGATDQCQIVLNDQNGILTAQLSSVEQQRQIVKVWRMFDDPTCQWGRDNALMLAGIIRPFSWSAQDNQITLSIGDLGPLLAKSISMPCSSSIFKGSGSGANITPCPQASFDKQLPLAWGLANRVEAVCVQAPWRTYLNQNTDGTNPITVTIKDDPDDLGLDGTGATVYQAYVGTDLMSVTFQQSNSPGTGTSTVTITAAWNPVIATAVILQTVDGAGNSRLLMEDQYILPAQYGDTLANYLVSGVTPVEIQSQTLGDVSTTLNSISVNSPWPGWYTFTINDPTNAILPYLKPGDRVKFLSPNPGQRAWPTGTMLREQGGASVYICNALPSKNIVRVEGFGTLADAAGNTRKDFVILGNYVETIINGYSTAKLSGGGLVANLNDNTWNNPVGTLLGNNVTTITFPNGTPRDLNNQLDDDRIWVTLQGVEDEGNSLGNLITNPALIVLQYLENPYLMNVAPTSINLAAFTAAAVKLAGYYCGFAQVEAADGLSLLQHICSLCHSVLFFDQGEANMTVLTDTPGAAVVAFDTSERDNLLLGSLSQSESAVDDVVNDITFKFRQNWDDIRGKNLLDSKNANLLSIAAFGRIAKEISPCDIYWRRQDVATERDWWLNHLSSIFRYVTFTAFLDALILQPGDAINVTWIDGGGRQVFAGMPMIVTKTTDTGKDGLVQIEARYVAFSYG